VEQCITFWLQNRIWRPNYAYTTSWNIPKMAIVTISVHARTPGVLMSVEHSAAHIGCYSWQLSSFRSEHVLETPLLSDQSKDIQTELHHLLPIQDDHPVAWLSVGSSDLPEIIEEQDSFKSFQGTSAAPNQYQQ
jgi:hypothetical protein